MQKLVALFCTVLLILLSTLPAFAQGELLTPPTLYSQAAVLMDADTGQVIYGKNMHMQMYPASLTKVMTCLLAIEKGNPKDVVTVTAEAIDAVPRNTTHIALTYGEQLTLEQLEYAMMVESANDAANAIAVHVGGSLKEFVKMMNERAAEIGASQTHFSNPNGLPEDDHYTTAYDLGLITRAALTHPVFHSLAGTESYELPPTNLQTLPRKLINRQYMFAHNDTYPGAFAGKTGWTEEAGRTLITIAERNGVTLIAVVMKPVAPGVSDPQFKDSTALLDYGFDHFKRITVPKTIIEPREVNGGVLSLDEDISVLLPSSVSPDFLELAVSDQDPENAYATLTAPYWTEQMMDTQVARVPLTLTVLTEAASDDFSPDVEKWFQLSTAAVDLLKWVGAILVGIIVILLLVREILMIRYRIRQKKLAEARRKKPEPKTTSPAPLTAPRPLSSYAKKDRIIDVRVDKGDRHSIRVLDRKR